MIPVKIEITRTTKAAVMRIEVGSPKYGFQGDYLPLTERSFRHRVGEITAPGYYLIAQSERVGTLANNKDATVVVGSRRIDTGYVQITEDGTVREITVEQVAVPAEYPRGE